MAAMISVPPVLPLLKKTMASPTPSQHAPSTQAIKVWSPKIVGSCPLSSDKSFWKRSNSNVRANVPTIVFKQKRKPNILMAAISKAALTKK